MSKLTQSKGARSKGTLIGLAIFSGYFALEAYTITKASHRTKPDYILPLLVRAQASMAACESDEHGLKERFERTLARVSSNLIEDLLEDQPALSVNEAKVLVNELAATEKNTVLTKIDEQSCSHQEIRAHLKRYEIYARKSR